AAFLGHLALAQAHGQVARAHHHAVHHAAHAAHAARQHLAEVLHHRAGRRVVARAADLHPASDLLHLERAPRHHHHVPGHHAPRPTHGHAAHRWAAHRRTLHHHRAIHHRRSSLPCFSPPPPSLFLLAVCLPDSRG